MRLSLLCLLFVWTSYGAKKFTVVLSPAGDAQNPGRLLADGTERGVARQLADQLKKRLEDETDARVIMTHETGEPITQEQKVNFANCLADFYCSLSVAAGEQLAISIFYYKRGTVTPLPTNTLAFYPAYQAYIFNAPQTEQYAKNFIDATYHHTFICNEPIGCPVTSLTGIIAPALEVEVIVNRMADGSLYLEPLVQALKKVIAHGHST